MTAEKSENIAGSILHEILKKIIAGTNCCLFFFMAAMGLVLAANISLRFLFEYPISWSNVISRYAYIYIVLLGTAISYIEGSHARIDFIYEAAPPKLRVFFDLCQGITAVFRLGHHGQISIDA